MQKVRWKELQSNPYLQALNPNMLTEEGHKVQKLDRIIGMSRYNDKIALEVTFDREYLVEYFSRAIFSKLEITEWNQIQSILSDAWKVHRDKTKKRSS